MPEAPVARSLRRNVGSALGGNLAYTLSQFLMLLAVVRLTDEERVGQYALALALTAPIFIFAGLKMRHVQVTDAAGENRSGEYVAVRLITSAVAWLFCAALGFAITSDVDYTVLIIAVATFKAAEAQVDVLYGVMQRQERLDLVARSMLTRGVLGAGVFAGTLYVTDSVSTSVLLLALLTVVFVGWESRIARRLGAAPTPEFSGVRLWKLMWLALPLGLSVAVGSLTTNMPRYFLEAFEGSASVGVFATIAYVLVATSLIGGAATEAAMPRLANHYSAERFDDFRSLTHRLALFGLALGLAGIIASWLVGEPLLTAVFGAPYGDANEVLVILMLAAALQYTSLAVGGAIYGMRMFRVQVPANVSALIVAAASGAALTSAHGLEGAAWSVVMTQAWLGLCYLFLYTTRLPSSASRRR